MNEKQVDPIAQRLRAEALDATPEFSPELHGRVMAALREKGLDLPLREERGRRAWRLGWRAAVPLAVAASIAVVAWVMARPGAPTDPKPQQIVEMPSVDPTQLMAPVHETVAPTAEVWQEGKYGYLDKDARRFMVFLASQIPGVPGDTTGK